jgi:hypothetical protein
LRRNQILAEFVAVSQDPILIRDAADQDSFYVSRAAKRSPIK